MAIRVFIFSLLIISILSLFIKVEQNNKNQNKQERELLSFSDSTLYILSENSIESIVQSKRALRYKNKDIMYEGKLISKGKDNTYDLDILQADVILKIKEKWTFLQNVLYTRDDFISLATNELEYNSIVGIARNNKPFTGIYNGNTIKGTHLYFDFNKSILKASNTHFEVDIKN